MKVNKDFKHTFSKDVHEGIHLQGVEVWRPALAYPYFLGFGLKKPRCECGRIFKNIEDYEAHYIYKAVWCDEDDYLFNLIIGKL